MNPIFQEWLCTDFIRPLTGTVLGVTDHFCNRRWLIAELMVVPCVETVLNQVVTCSRSPLVHYSYFPWNVTGATCGAGNVRSFRNTWFHSLWEWNHIPSHSLYIHYWICQSKDYVYGLMTGLFALISLTALSWTYLIGKLSVGWKQCVIAHDVSDNHIILLIQSMDTLSYQNMIIICILNLLYIIMSNRQ